MIKTILYKQMRIAKYNKNLALKTAKHSLLLDDDKNIYQNRIVSKSHLNKYCFRGKDISQKEERREALAYIDKMFSNDNNQVDTKRFSKLKYKIKKWIESEKTTLHEKGIFEKILVITNNHKNKTVDVEKVINIFKASDEKITRFNDKLKAIFNILNIHNDMVGKEIDHSSQLNIRLIELLLKIPKHNGSTISTKIQEKALRSYYAKNFGNFEMFLIITHNDEIVPHLHLFIDGLNKNTKKCDFVEFQYNYIKEKRSLSNFPLHYSSCTNNQVKEIGELLQEDFYNHLNVFLVENGFDITFKKKDLNKDELKLRKVIKTNNSKRIAYREFNTANYIATKNKLLYREKSKLEEKIIKIESDLQRLQVLIKLALKYAVQYAKDSLVTSYKKFTINYDEITLIDRDIAEKVKVEAIELQNSKRNKTKIKNYG